MLTNLSSLTLGDLCAAAMKECSALGVGQTALAEDITDAWARLQFMLREWQRKRWLVYHLKDYALTSTGAQSYTIGPGGNFDTGAGASSRPDKLSAAWIRQINVAAPNQPDYPMRIIESYEDYSDIAVKQLKSFPGAVFLDTAMPLGNLYFWPVPTATIYEMHVLIKEQLPFQFANQAATFTIPEEYYSAMMYNLALRLCPKYGLQPSQILLGLAKESLNTVREANVGIKELSMPQQISRPGLYNIYSDRMY